MIRVKIINPDKGRNKNIFSIFQRYKDTFFDVGVEFVDNGFYDFLFIGMADFINKNKPLNESINDGVTFVNSQSGTKFLFDGSDSTSLMGAIEVFRQTDSKYLFKNQLLSRVEYRTPTSFNKWFFGKNGDLDLSYDITEEEFKRIKLSGYNLGYHNDYSLHMPLKKDKQFDLCAIFNSEHPVNHDHTFRNDLHYNLHRQRCKSEVDKLNDKYKVITGKFPFEVYANHVINSKFSLSPFGMGEVCFRDFEIMLLGSCLIKPNMSKVNTIPNIYTPDTYVPTSIDFCFLKHQLEKNKECFIEKTENFRREYLKNYNNVSFVTHWYNIFKEINTVGTE